MEISEHMEFMEWVRKSEAGERLPVKSTPVRTRPEGTSKGIRFAFVTSLIRFSVPDL